MNLSLLKNLNTKEYSCKTIFLGKEYKNTKELKNKDLKLFIERDIFLAIKNNILPTFKYDIIFTGLNQNQVKVIVFDPFAKNSSESRKLLSLRGFFQRFNFKKIIDQYRIKYELFKITFKYNFLSFQLRARELAFLNRRFNFRVGFT